MNKDILFDFKAVFDVDDYLYFYENLISKEQTQKEFDFLIQEMDIQKNMKILDLACGHGRHSNLLAEFGCSVIGIDTNSDFLNIAKTQADHMGLKVDYNSGDMRKISFQNEFDRVVILFTSFGYFDDMGNFEVLNNINRALKPHGMFCFDLPNRDRFLKNLPPFLVTEKGNDLMIDRHFYNFESGRWENRRIVIRNGIRKDKPFSVRLYTFQELKEMLRKSQFRLFKVFGDWDGESYSSNSKRMIIIAEKISY